MHKFINSIIDDKSNELHQKSLDNFDYIEQNSQEIVFREDIVQEIINKKKEFVNLPLEMSKEVI